MARYRFSIDLGAFLGVRHISVPVGDGGTSVSGIFIPTGINGIEVKEDTREDGKCNQSKLRVFINLMQRGLASAYLTAVRNRLLSKGEQVTPYNVPAWSVCYSLPEEKRNAIRASLKQRVLRDHPEWAAQEDVKGTDLSGAISRLMPFQLGDSYLIEESGQQPQTPSVAPVAQQVSGYTPAATNEPDPNWPFPPRDDNDLAF